MLEALKSLFSFLSSSLGFATELQKEKNTAAMQAAQQAAQEQREADQDSRAVAQALNQGKLDDLRKRST